MADNRWQSAAIVSAASDIQVVHPAAFVAADILVYPEKGNRNNCIAPDVLLAFGVGAHSRSAYFVWQEGKPPDWVLEVASPSTVSNDLEVKPVAYASMGVPEYWLFDPKGDVLPRRQPRLQGLTLVDGRYEALEPRLAHGQRVIHSVALGLDLRADGELIRFRDPATGKDIRHHGESESAAEREAARRKAAEADATRERSRANQERARANREAADRKAAQLRVAELEAALQRLRAGSADRRH